MVVAEAAAKTDLLEKDYDEAYEDDDNESTGNANTEKLSKTKVLSSAQKQKRKEEKQFQLYMQWKRQQSAKYKERAKRVEERAQRLKNQRRNKLTPSELQELVARNGLDDNLIFSPSETRTPLPSKEKILENRAKSPRPPSMSPRAQRPTTASGAVTARPHIPRHQTPEVMTYAPYAQTARPSTSTGRKKKYTVSKRLFDPAVHCRPKHTLHNQPTPVKPKFPSTWGSKGSTFGAHRYFYKDNYPGPGAYKEWNAMGSDSSKWSMTHRHFFVVKDEQSPGPGSHDPLKPIGEGRQKKTIATPIAPIDHPTSPGPQVYEPYHDIGTLKHGNPQISFSPRTKLWKIHADQVPTPGPGSHERDSFVDLKKASKTISLPENPSLSTSGEAWKPGVGTYTTHETHLVGGKGGSPHPSMHKNIPDLALDNFPGPGSYTITHSIGNPYVLGR